MNLKTHFIVTLLLFIGFYPYYKYAALFVFVGGFLIDADHYAYYIFKTKDFSLRTAYLFSKDKTHNNTFCIFHSFEFLALLFAAGFFSKYIMLIAVAASVHFAMDLIYIAYFRHLGREIRALSWIGRLTGRR